MMTEGTTGTNSSHNSTPNTDSSNSRQRKKRKWDQPAESVLLSAVPSVFHVNPAMPVPKLNQIKVQDELIIAREIVINDAESSVRCKLTKRQTQEEIQKCTGAVVITRGKYRPPNAPPDGEKPLYLHISAGAHLKDTTERILAVDRAAAMVDEMLKQSLSARPASSILQTATGNEVKALSTSLFLGFDPDPSLNIPTRIRGPNDQYINHIMNETGATVVLRGCGSGNLESPNAGEALQQLHLFLSASSLKSLEDAKCLAENLLDTIRLECGVPRASTFKVYNAVPPPLSLAGVQGCGNDPKVTTSPAAGLAFSTVNSTLSMPTSGSIPEVATTFSQGTVSSSGIVSCGQPPTNLVGYPQPSVTGGTSYSGYGGIYPQATPLQQVAFALRQSPSPISSAVIPTASVAASLPKPNIIGALDKEKRPTQRRKFQEVPIGSNGSAKAPQGSELLKLVEKHSADLGLRNTSNMPAPRKLVQPSSSEMPPPPPRSMPPPPQRSMPSVSPPPKFTSASPANRQDKKYLCSESKSDAVSVASDTLVKLMEYGDEDDDLEDSTEVNGNSCGMPDRKPFWAL